MHFSFVVRLPIQFLPAKVLQMSGHEYGAQERIWRHRRWLDIAAKFVDYDFKDFIDKPVRLQLDAVNSTPQDSLDELLHAIDGFLRDEEQSKSEVAWQDFVEKHFDEPGHDLIAVPFQSDWSSLFLDRSLPNKIQLWRRYLLKVYDQLHVRCNRQIVSSLIVLPHPFVIPGGRFREAYYWDSHWTCLGLNICGRPETSRSMIDNFVHLVKTLGFVPNGNRVYYSTRSQPPMLCEMVLSYLETKSGIGRMEPLPLMNEFNTASSSTIHDCSSQMHDRIVRHTESILNKLKKRLAG